MSSIAENLQRVLDTLNDGVNLIAVSKTKPNEAIEEAYAAGHRAFGENKAQEMAGKHEALPKDIEWHMIGHLQRNKVKYIAPFVHLIHGVDSPRLLREIQKQGEKCDRVIDCLLQIHIAEESTKFGFSADELKEFLATGEWQEMPNIRLRGLMGMATYTDDEAQIKREFSQLRKLSDELKSGALKEVEQFDQLSMGMSGDYQIAMQEGSTMVRVGSSIFGARNYG